MDSQWLFVDEATDALLFSPREEPRALEAGPFSAGPVARQMSGDVADGSVLKQLKHAVSSYEMTPAHG